MTEREYLKDALLSGGDHNRAQQCPYHYRLEWTSPFHNYGLTISKARIAQKDALDLVDIDYSLYYSTMLA